jgi:hypothetical protein
MKKHPIQPPKTLLDLATDKHPIGDKGMSLDEALAQVDRLNNGDKELKRIIRDAYGTQKPKKQ